MARVCRQLTDAELAALIALGWTMVAGPFATQAGCEAYCAGSGTYVNPDTGTGTNASTVCCTNPLPLTLTATFVGCMAGTIPIIYNSAETRWQGTGSISCTDWTGTGTTLISVSIELLCIAGSWVLNLVVNSSPCKSGSNESYCEPLVIEFVVDIKCMADDCPGCTGSSCSVVITE